MSRPLERVTERLTLDDLRTIQEVMTRLTAEHRLKVQRLERAQQMTDTARRAGIYLHREAVTRYSRIADGVGLEILALDGEL